MRAYNLLAAIIVVAFSFTQVGPALADGDCSPVVQQQQQTLQQQTINSNLNLASNFYTPMPSTFSNMSCLDKLLSGGLDIIFQPPNLSAIISAIENAVCAKAQDLVNQAKAPIVAAISSATSSVSGSGSALGDIIPGVNIGSLTGGLSITQTGSNSITTNLGSVFGSSSTATYTINRASLANGLFGN